MTAGAIRLLVASPAIPLVVLGTHSLQIPEPALPVFKDGQAQVVPAFDTPNDWVREHLWVETEFDSDRDGKRDRVHVDVIRPRQTETEGLRVPAIYESSPYFAGNSGDFDVNWDIHQKIGDPPKPRTAHPNIGFDPNRKSVSNDYVRSFVPRGFAMVHSEAPGTGLSTGAVTIGGMPERYAPKAVIDWMNGRAKGFTSVDGTEEIKATWCTGKVGMLGTSYNGTMCVAAATTGVKGLEAIIPVAPNTSYYHYYRTNGLVRNPGGYPGEDVDSLFDFVNSGDPSRRPAGEKLYRDGEFLRGQDRETGDYNAFWESRDLLKYAKNIKCAVLMSHGFNDWNVVPEHSVRISQAVKGKVPLVQYFHQGGHGGDPPFEMMNKWFTRFLYGVENGIEKGPKAYIVRGGEMEGVRRRGEVTPYADYPNPEAKPVILYPSADGRKVGELTQAKASKGMLDLVDDATVTPMSMARAVESPNRLLFTTKVLSQPVHLSGFSRVQLRLASTAPGANLSVYLVQLPGPNGGDSGVITRGWADPQNADSLKSGGDYHARKAGRPLAPGKFVNLSFDLEPDDQLIPAGTRIGLMIFSSDHDFTLWPPAGTKLTVDLGATKISLPVVGGEKALSAATD